MIESSINLSINDVCRANQCCLYSSRLLQAMQDLADDIPLGNQTFATVRKNIALSVSMVDSASSTGLTIESLRTARTGYNNVTLIQSNSQRSSNKAIVSTFLPRTLLRRLPVNAKRLSAIVYDNVKLFLTSPNSSNSQIINSKVMSIAFKDVQLKDLPAEDELRILFAPINRTVTGSVSCVFWNFSLASMMSSLFLSLF